MVFWHWFQDTGWFAKQIHITYLGGYSQVISTAGVGFTLDKMLKRISEVTNEPLLSSETNAIIWLVCSQVKALLIEFWRKWNWVHQSVHMLMVVCFKVADLSSGGHFTRKQFVKMITATSSSACLRCQVSRWSTLHWRNVVSISVRVTIFL